MSPKAVDPNAVAWLVSGLPITATHRDIQLAFFLALAPPAMHSQIDSVTDLQAQKLPYTVDLRNTGAAVTKPFAFVKPCASSSSSSAEADCSKWTADAGILKSGITICGVACKVKRRRPPKAVVI